MLRVSARRRKRNTGEWRPCRQTAVAALGLETHAQAQAATEGHRRARSCTRQAAEKSDEQERRKNEPGGVLTNVVVVMQGDLYQIPAQVPDPTFYRPWRICIACATASSSCS